jgi:hypothetical protein
MPTVLRSGPYRYFFYSADCAEPAHIHIERDQQVAKLWLVPLHIAESGGFKQRELGRIRHLVAERQALLLKAWHEHCNS